MISGVAKAIAISLLAAAIPAVADDATEPDRSPMSAKLRGSFSNIVVRAGSATAGQFVTGSYKKDIMDMEEGAAKGAKMGTIGREIGGVPIYFPIRVISVPASIIGALAGKTQEEIQAFRDRLTRDLMEAQDQPMTNEALADDVFWRVRAAPGVKAKVLAHDMPLPADTDAVLYVSLDSVQMTVEGKQAVITTTATATLRRIIDGEHVFEQQITYQDRDDLQDWIKNDDAAWHSYAAYARHYLGREISAQLYERVAPWQSAQPAKSPDIKAVRKNRWHGKTKSTTPTLAWELSLDDAAIDTSSIRYDVEVYDLQKMVYAARAVAEPQFTLPYELEGCTTYYWSVRPSVKIGAETRYGEWMRLEDGETTGSGGNGRKASMAPAYLYDFASFEVSCR